MPEAAVNKNRNSVLRENEVRRPGQVTGVQPVAEALRMKVSSYSHLGFRVFRPDPCHHSRPSRRIDYVHFSWYPMPPRKFLR